MNVRPDFLEAFQGWRHVTVERAFLLAHRMGWGPHKIVVRWVFIIIIYVLSRLLFFHFPLSCEL